MGWGVWRFCFFEGGLWHAGLGGILFYLMPGMLFDIEEYMYIVCIYPGIYDFPPPARINHAGMIWCLAIWLNGSF